MTNFVLKLGAHELSLGIGRWRLGRDAQCEIRIDNESVSRTHAVLTVESSRVFADDHGSRNGVRINGKKIVQRTEVQIGDRIGIGTEELVLLERADPFSIDAHTKPVAQKAPLVRAELSKLSPRELEVLVQIAYGATQREVAEKLDLSVKTVETYRARLSDKLGLRSRAELVRFALDAGLLSANS